MEKQNDSGVMSSPSETVNVTSSISNSSNNDGDALNSCPICNKVYEPQDISYALQCVTKQCSFNMCTECTKSLLQSTSSQEVQTASDGNIYSLQSKCPSCRGSFGVSLNDILLLRENDNDILANLKGKKDSELSAAELRIKYDDDRLNVIKNAQRRYNNFCNDDSIVDESINGQSIKVNEKRSGNSYDDGDDNMEMIKYKEQKMEYIDSFLFYGLSNSMSNAERIYVKELMTSGSTKKIVQATYILASIVDMNRNRGGTPSMRINQSNQHQIRQTRSEGSNNESYIYTQRYKSYEEKINEKRVKSTKAMAATVCMPLSVHNQSKLQLDNNNREKWKRLYPIPSRMPKAITLKLNFDLSTRWNCQLTFIDDEESFMDLRQNIFNGNNASKDVRSNLVRDAFQELKTTFNRKKIIKKEPNNATGVENILAVINNDDYFHDEKPSITIPWRRVVVASASGEALRSGIRAGDVITHIEGEVFDGNAEKLRLILSRKQQETTYMTRSFDEGSNNDHWPSCQIVVNAEVGVAEALRIRNLVAESQMD